MTLAVTAALLTLEMLFNTGDKCECNPKISNLERQSTVLCLKFEEKSIFPLLSVCVAIHTGMRKIQFASNYAEFIFLNSTGKTITWKEQQKVKH